MSAKEAPTLYPTEEEFRDPIGYLNSPEILELGLKYGILKVSPPRSYKPPFCLNLSTFKFHTRLQKLNELDLLNRSRKFWLIGFNNFLKTMGLSLDVSSKYMESSSEDDELIGYLELTDGNLVHLYDIFIEEQNKSKVAPLVFKKDLPVYNAVFKYGASLKALLENDHQDNKPNKDDPLDFRYLYKAKNYTYSYAPSSKCEVCGGKDDPEKILLCDGKDCNKVFHIGCLEPPLMHIPKTDWFCNECIKGSTNDYGFEEDFDSIFTIGEFRDDCTRFKREYCSKYLNNNQNPSIDVLEKEFWRLVTDEEYNKNLEVRYGADIHNTAVDEISGFPMAINPNVSRFAKFYNDSNLKDMMNHPFSLPNLPFAKGSLLNYIKGTATQDSTKNEGIISGMTVPWIYIGSMFSTFCWHKEDHYTLSANYCHVGDTKKWYGIPSSSCDIFEKVFQTISPDYFKKQPDLLHQLVSLLSPQELIELAKTKFDQNLEVYYINQNPNEFVITYPKVYHAGFNCGFNVNEAVNFTMSSWIHQGSVAIDEYKLVKRDNVFNHYKLLLNILDEFFNIKDIASRATKAYKNMIKTSFVDLCFELGKFNKLLDVDTKKKLGALETVEAVEVKDEDNHNGYYHSRMRFKNVNQKKMRSSNNGATGGKNSAEDDDEDENLCHECKTSLNLIWFEIDTLRELFDKQDARKEREREAKRLSIASYEQLPQNYKDINPARRRSELEPKKNDLLQLSTTPELNQHGYDLPTPEKSPVSIEEASSEARKKKDRESEFQKIIDEAMKSAKEDSSSPGPPLKRLRSAHGDRQTSPEILKGDSDSSNLDVRKSRRLATKTDKLIDSLETASKTTRSSRHRRSESIKDSDLQNIESKDEQVLFKARKRRLRNEKYGKHLICFPDFKKMYLDKVDNGEKDSITLERLKNITTVYKERDVLELTNYIVRDIQPKVLDLLQ